MIKVLVTGATGLLGRAIMHNLRADSSVQVLGLGYSRVGEGVIKCDITNHDELKGVVEHHSPDVIIHAAAERRPDVAANDPAATEHLNVAVSANVAGLARSVKAALIYISTDYVFDGTKPPYEVTDTPNPLNLYGKTKLAGEKAVHENNQRSIVVRVPVLYGKVENNKESAVTVLIDGVKDSLNAPKKFEHLSKRFPTHVENVAQALNALSKWVASADNITPIIHYTSTEGYTKYEMACIFADILGIPRNGLIADTQEPQGAAAVSRPKDCQLSRNKLDDLNLDMKEDVHFVRLRSVSEPSTLKIRDMKLLGAAAAAAAVALFAPAYAAEEDIYGTWSSGSGGVQTGEGFCTPQEYSFNIPNTTGTSYSFTEDGYYEEASYKFRSNATHPQCIQAVLTWQHGTYEFYDHEDMQGIKTTPFSADGRVQVEDPCAASSNILSTTSFNHTFVKYLPFDDPVKNIKALQLYDFDGSELAPLYLISRQPNMLPTSPISTQYSKRSKRSTDEPVEGDVDADMQNILATPSLERRKGGGGKGGGGGRVSSGGGKVSSGGAGRGANVTSGNHSSAVSNTLPISLAALVIVAASIAIV
ncbi:hypothetical protein E3P81_01448 [Wallemia ichthyophaga]|nr:hypothetical protein E3P97_01449 [Wallemia ichthyophaga]TIB05930.1 hypothetical protein E3P96_00755 [Wallemia ichthyophaga]TIB32165.1 hypothetical protein E3P85_01950 [Wallemia ichthyophaga]TIB47982.1 hypothetical protein E3P82_01447 [Wallemia ichthyophaga]TIB52156.1 hypothetical protein E3P81_01448 [Wallemia ichthyophaga]